MRFKNTAHAVDRIPSDLGVSYLLEGSVQTTTDRIGMTVRLIETETESQLWAGQGRARRPQPVDPQREVAEAITTRSRKIPSHALPMSAPIPVGIQRSPRHTRNISAGTITAQGYKRRALQGAGALSEKDRPRMVLTPLPIAARPRPTQHSARPAFDR